MYRRIALIRYESIRKVVYARIRCIDICVGNMHKGDIYHRGALPLRLLPDEDEGSIVGIRSCRAAGWQREIRITAVERLGEIGSSNVLNARTSSKVMLCPLHDTYTCFEATDYSEAIGKSTVRLAESMLFPSSL